MIWKNLQTSGQLEEIIRLSHTEPQVIFKHSTRCSISSVIKNRLEKSATGEEQVHYLDLIAHRPLSNSIAETFGVQHESPQVLVIKDGTCVFHESHMAIHYEDLRSHLHTN
jgi:bacillithiol system protein YtxJ